MSNRVHLHVCNVCTDTNSSGEDGLGAGERLLELLNRALDKGIEREKIELQPYRCLMACSEGCMVSLSQQGKMQYLLGRLPVEQDTADALLAFARMYAESATGIVPNHRWPGNLAMHFLGRIPPLEPSPDGDWNELGCDL